MVICNATDYFTYSKEAFDQTTQRLKAFLKGYLKVRSLTGEEVQSIYDWVGIYHYQLQATIIEIYGLDCVDHDFLDKQLDWLMQWQAQLEELSFSFYDK